VIITVHGKAAAEPRPIEPAGEGPGAFLGRAALIRNKRASGRRKDLTNIESLGED
jgi:hypothetical protein